MKTLVIHILILCGFLFAGEHTAEYPALNQSFDRNSMTNGNSWLMAPGRLNMEQSYTMSYMSSSTGTSQSQGVYLNHVTLNLSTPLRLFADIGYHTPFHSDFQSSDPRFQSMDQKSSMILPRVGLEYQPSDQVLMSLSVIQGQDAQKAWGSPYWRSPLSRSQPWSQRNRHRSRLSK